MLEGRALDQFMDRFWGEEQRNSVSDSGASGKKLSGTAFLEKEEDLEE